MVLQQDWITKASRYRMTIHINMFAIAKGYIEGGIETHIHSHTHTFFPQIRLISQSYNFGIHVKHLKSLLQLLIIFFHLSDAFASTQFISVYKNPIFREYFFFKEIPMQSKFPLIPEIRVSGTCFPTRRGILKIKSIMQKSPAKPFIAFSTISYNST